MLQGFIDDLKRHWRGSHLRVDDLEVRGQLKIIDETTVLGLWDRDGSITIGEVGAGKSNVYINAGEVHLRNNTTDVIVLATTESRIENLLKMSGANAALSIGATPPTSATAGTGIWLDRTGLYDLVSNVQVVSLTATGLTVKASLSGYDDLNSYRFVASSGATLGGMYLYHSAGVSHTLRLHSASVASESSYVQIYAVAPATYVASVQLLAYSSTQHAVLTGMADTNGVETPYFVTDCDLRVDGGLYVGSGSIDPADNCIVADGTVTGTQLVSNIAIGTAPLVITSTTKVDNLNVDMVDGYHHDQSLLTTVGPTFDHLHLNGNLNLDAVSSSIIFGPWTTTGSIQWPYLVSAATVFLQAMVDGDVYNRFKIQADGKVWWGGGGVTTDVDTNLYRSAANVLKTDDSLVVAGGVLTVTSTAPSLVLTDTTASAKGLTVYVDSNLANLRESAGASGSLLVLDLANNLVGIGTTAPGGGLHSKNAPQWSSYNWGPSVVIDGGRNNCLGILDSNSTNPWAIANLAGELAFATMPALGNTANAPTYRMKMGTAGGLAFDTYSASSNDIRTPGGIALGIDADPGNGNVEYLGALLSAKNSTTYTVYGMVVLAAPLTSTAWDGDSFSSVGKTLIDLSAVFGVPAGVKAVLVRVIARDSGSASSTSGLGIMLSPNNTASNGPLHLRIDSLPNDMYGESGGVVIPCDANGDIYYQTYASGANTLDVVLQIWGYLI